MSPIRRKTSSLPTLQIAMAIAMVAVVVILGVYMLAPNRPVAPKPNTLDFVDAPEDKTRITRTDNTEFDDGPLINTGAPAAVTTPVEEPENPAGGDFSVAGLVRDSRTNEPIKDARVVVRLQQPDAVPSSGRRNPLGKAVRSGSTGEDGRFTLDIAEAGDYVLEAQAPDYMIATVAVGPLNTARPLADLDIPLSTGARIYGRVVEDGSTMPISELRVTTTDQRHMANTDANGDYVLTGLAPGEYDVSVDLSDTLFKSGQTLPFQKVEITSADQEVRGIDFAVAPAGMVWGYVVTPEGEPVQSAQVLLATSDSALTQAINSMMKQAPPLSDRSEDDGYYELVGVPLNEEWRVYASSNDFSPQLAEPFMLNASHRSARVNITLFGGTTVSGRVVDSKGGPVSEAEVMCLPNYSDLMSPMHSAQAFRGATSDASGNFLVEELPAGNYQVFARKKGYKVAIVGEPIYPDGYNNINGVQIVLDAVDSGEHAIFGRVSDTAGELLSGANVELSGVGTSMSGIERSETTDGSGEFRFDGVEAGGYSLTVTMDGYAPRKVGRVALDKPTNIILDAAALVRGRVLVKESNAAPPQYTVAALPMKAASGGTLDIMRFMRDRISESFANPDGSYELYVPAGEYKMQAESPDYTPGVEMITLEPGQVIDDLDLFVSSEGGIIAGIVSTSDGNSPQGATVYLVPANSPAEALVLVGAGEEAGVKTTLVGSDGAFSFEQLAEGNYVVIVQHANYANGQSDVLPLQANNSIDNVDVRLGTGGVLEGYVYRNGRIAQNTMVMVLGNGATESDTTDENGYYMIDGLATGTYQAMVLSSGGGLIPNPMDTEGVPVDIIEGESTRYDFGAGEGVQIQGICSPPPPPGLLSGAVVLRMPGFSPTPLGETVGIDSLTQGHFRGIDGTGQFELNDVQPGEWQIDVYYVEPGNLLEVRYVHTELLVVTGEEDVMPVELYVDAY